MVLEYLRNNANKLGIAFVVISWLFCWYLQARWNARNKEEDVHERTIKVNMLFTTKVLRRLK